MPPGASSTYGILIESKSQGSGFDESVRNVERLDSGVNKLSQNATGFSSQTSALGQSIKQIGLESAAGSSRLGSMASALSGFNLAAAAAVGIAGALATSVLNATRAIGDYQEKTDLAREATGLTEKEIGGLRVAASNVGRDFESISTNLAMFNRHIAEAREGTGTAFDSFKRLGLSLEDLKNSTTGEVLEKVRAGLKGVGDESDRSKILFDLFGRSGSTMLGILQQDANATEELAQKLGITLTEAQQKAARAADVAGDRMKLAWGGLMNTISAAVAPAGTAIINWATTSIEWLKKVHDEIEMHTVGALKDLEEASKSIKGPDTSNPQVSVGPITVVESPHNEQLRAMVQRAQDQLKTLRETIPVLDYQRSIGAITADQELKKLQALRAQALTKAEILTIDEKISRLPRPATPAFSSDVASRWDGRWGFDPVRPGEPVPFSDDVATRWQGQWGMSPVRKDIVKEVTQFDMAVTDVARSVGAAAASLTVGAFQFDQALGRIIQSVFNALAQMAQQDVPGIGGSIIGGFLGALGSLVPLRAGAAPQLASTVVDNVDWKSVTRDRIMPELRSWERMGG